MTTLARGVITSFSDGGDADYVSKPEMIEALKEYSANFSTHAMSEYTMFLQGQKERLEDVIEWLERI